MWFCREKCCTLLKILSGFYYPYFQILPSHPLSLSSSPEGRKGEECVLRWKWKGYVLMESFVVDFHTTKSSAMPGDAVRCCPWRVERGQSLKTVVSEWCSEVNFSSPFVFTLRPFVGLSVGLVLPPTTSLPYILFGRVTHLYTTSSSCQFDAAQLHARTCLLMIIGHVRIDSFLFFQLSSRRWLRKARRVKMTRGWCGKKWRSRAENGDAL